MNTKVNTFFKRILLAFVVFAVALTFTACGSKPNQFKEINVNIDGDYQAANPDTVIEMIDADQSEETGLRMSVDMSITYPEEGTINVKGTELIKIHSNTETEMVMHVAAKMKTSGMGTSQTVTIYEIITYDKANELFDIEMYVDAGEGKFKVAVNDLSKEELEEENIMGELGLPVGEDAFDMVKPDVDMFAGATSIKTAVEGDVTKIEVVSPVAEMDTSVTSYYIYKNGAFDKFIVEMAMQEEMYEGVFMNMTMVYEGEIWNGDIEFPNLAKYQDMSALE